MSRILGAVTLLAFLVLVGCGHSSPQVVQVFSQVNQVFDPPSQTWGEGLSVFVQGANADGTKVFDRLHLVHEGLYFTLTPDQWVSIDRPGESWFGANNLRFPQGKVSTGEWRVILVTKAGLEAQTTFLVPPLPIETAGGTPPAVSLTALAQPGQYKVSGWVPDYLVWARDPKGVVIARTKTAGDQFSVPLGTDSVVLYSYDKIRGQGLEAGPFSLKPPR